MSLLKKILGKEKSTKNVMKTERAINKDNDLIIAIINRGFSDFVVEASRDAGATGATIIYGRSSMNSEKNFLGISIQPEKEIVLILTPKENCSKIMKEILSRTSLNEQGNGICFSLPVNAVASRHIEKIKPNISKKTSLANTKKEIDNNKVNTKGTDEKTDIKSTDTPKSK